MSKTSEMTKTRVQGWVVRDDENMMADLMNGPLYGLKVVEECRLKREPWQTCTHGENIHRADYALRGETRVQLSRYRKYVLLVDLHMEEASST
jgi:hypothetical protein